MRYIKLFEQHQLYTEISQNEMDLIFEDNQLEDFTTNEFNIISNLLDNEYVTVKYCHNTDRPKAILELWDLDKMEVTIWKGVDEWFYIEDVRYDSVYYKCDQFIGLIECLNKEGFVFKAIK